jgi:hypothetical protein
MKGFLTKFVLFTLLIGSVLAGLILLSDLAIEKRKREVLKISDDVNIIFAGDSHVECSVNDDMIANSINIARSGEAYLYSFAKIKSLIDYNDQITAVFIGYSYGDLLKDKETRWLFEDAFVIEFVKTYNYLLSDYDKSIIFRNNPKAYLKGLTRSAYENCLTLLQSFFIDSNEKRKIKNYGGYLYLVRDKLQEDINMIETYINEPLEKSLLQEEYLKMLSQYCLGKSVKLILLNTPKYDYYNLNVNRDILRNWISFRQSLPCDSLLDLSSFNLPDSCYGDMTHLNYRGAELFSSYLNNIIHSGGNEQP